MGLSFHFKFYIFLNAFQSSLNRNKLPETSVLYLTM